MFYRGAKEPFGQIVSLIVKKLYWRSADSRSYVYYYYFYGRGNMDNIRLIINPTG